MAYEKPIWSNDGQTLSNVLIKDSNTYGTYNVTEDWYDGSAMDDSKLDSDLVYVKYEGKYLVRNFEYGQVLQKDTMTDMRGLSTIEVIMLKMGVYKHIQLNGYYVKGDTPGAIEYKLSDTPDSDDAGSVIEVQDIKLEHDFKEGANLAYFGLQDGDDIFDTYNTAQLKYTKILIPQGYYYTSMTLPLKSNFEVLNVGDVTIESTGGACDNENP